MSNLEPIEDSDLDLKKKFAEGGAPPPKMEAPQIERKMPNLAFPEAVPERKEGAAEKDATYSKILAKVKTPIAPVHTSVAEDAQAASTATGVEGKIEKLIQLAQQKGVIHAVKVARHLDDNYALDEFHDRLLAEELHDALVKKGLIREI